MNLDTFFILFLTSISSMLGVTPLPKNSSSDWVVSKNWHQSNNYWELEATSRSLVNYCKIHADHYIDFPSVLHGAQEIFVNNILIKQYGDPTFKTTQSFFGGPILKCKEIQWGDEIRWKVYSYTAYFSRILFYPQPLEKNPGRIFYFEALNLMAGGSLVLLSIYSLLIFWGREDKNITLSITVASLFFSGYFLFGAIGFLGFDLPMLLAHKVADFSVWVGCAFFFNGLRLSKLIGNNVYLAYLVFVSLAIVFILTGATGDAIQFGTTLPFGFTIVLCLTSICKLGVRLRSKGITRRDWFPLIGLTLFVVTALNEIALVLGVMNTHTLLNIGCAGLMLFFVCSLDTNITQSYRELFELRVNLEQTVREKTLQLQNKTTHLEEALQTLTKAQADLVQSEKLAALGTLSAGIAHELNNSINFISNSIGPMEKYLNKNPDSKEKEVMVKLLRSMSKGADLSAGIIKNLKAYSGLDRGEISDVNIFEAIEIVLSLLKHKLREDKIIRVNVPKSLSFQGSFAGFSQLIMNVISNALDAIGGQGLIEVEVIPYEVHFVLTVKDSGVGIPEEFKDRIFDPFFTTKDVGKGTGLGLFVVRNEVRRHQGEIRVESMKGKGTSFVFTFPFMREI